MRRTCITGVTSGLGKELAHLCHKRGDLLILVGRDPEKLADLESLFPGSKLFQCDLEDPAPLLHLLQQEPIDLLINNAGFGLYGNATSISIEKQINLLRVNVEAVVRLTLEVSRLFVKEKREGIVMNIGSVGGLVPTPGMAVYGASKAFLWSFSESLDFELQPSGVRVLLHAPGQIKTLFASKAAGRSVTHASFVGLDSKKVAKAVLRQIEKKRAVQLYDWRYRLARFLLPKWFIKKRIFSTIEARISS